MSVQQLPPLSGGDPRMKPPPYDSFKDNVHWYHGILLLVLLAVAAAVFSSGAIAGLLLLNVIPLVFSHKVTGPRLSAKLQVSAVVVVWVGSAVLSYRYGNSVRTTVYAAITLVVICTLNGWERLGLRYHRTRHRTNKLLDRRAKRHITEGFSRFGVAVGLPIDAYSVDVVKRPRGLSWFIYKGPWLLGNVRDLADKIAGYLGVGQEQVEVLTTDNAAVFRADLNMVDTLEKMPAWGPSPRETITKPIELGLNYDEKPVSISLDDTNIKIIGTTGSGKSSVMEIMLLAALAAPDARAWILDPLKNATPFGAYEDHVDVFANTYELTIRALFEIERVSRERGAWMFENKIKIWPTSPTHPLILVFIDEALTLTVNSKINAHLYELARGVRQQGIRIVFGAHRADAKDFGSGLRGVTMTTILLAVDNATSARVAIDGFPMPAHEYKMGGYFAVHQQGWRRPIEGRGWHPTEPVVRAFLARLAPPAPCDYEVSKLPTRSESEVDRLTSDDSEAIATTASGVELDLKARTLLDVLLVDGGVVIQSEIKKRTRDLPTDLKLGNERTIQDKAAVLVARGFAVAHGSTSWSITDAGRAHLEHQEVRT